MSSRTALIFTCIICVTLVSSAQKSKYKGTNVPKIIQSHGYPIEIHEVITDDGYVIELHRIPYGIKNQTSGENHRKVIILSHCILCSSSVFVVMGPSKALAYILADDGYDVWLLNSRGTKASRKHVSLSDTDSEYWKFSWTEQGLYDVSAVIDYTLKVTDEPQVDYVAFSMGNAQLLALLSERPQYNEKIRTLISLAPAVFMGSSTGTFPFPPPFSDIFLHNGVRSGDLQFPPNSASKEMITLLSGACNPVLKFILGSACQLAFKLIGGNINGNVNNDSLYYYFKFFPDTISLRAAMHYTQLKKTARFEKFSFGRRMNKKIYGSIIPPSFNLSNVRIPVNIIYSVADSITNYKDVRRLGSKIPNLVNSYIVPFKTFSHMDFVWGRNAPNLVYSKILERLHVDYNT